MIHSENGLTQAHSHRHYRLSLDANDPSITLCHGTLGIGPPDQRNATLPCASALLEGFHKHMDNAGIVFLVKDFVDHKHGKVKSVAVLKLVPAPY